MFGTCRCAEAEEDATPDSEEASKDSNRLVGVLKRQRARAAEPRNTLGYCQDLTPLLHKETIH